MSELPELRRKEATKIAVKYFVISFVAVAFMSGLIAYAVINAKRQARDSYAIKVEYCKELEKLKTQNREDLARDKKHYKRNLRLLGIKETPELDKAVHEQWALTAKRNKPKPCPYTA